jgi:bla regulator protein BlaR1
MIHLSPVANHLWQSTLCVGVVWLWTLALRKQRAAVRYRLWFAASVKFLIPFSLLVSLGSEFEWRSAPVIAPAQWSSVIDQVSRPFATPVPHAPAAALNPIPAILVAVWLCGFTISMMVWLRYWRRMRAAHLAAKPLSRGLPIPVLSCPMRMEPGVFGVLKPVILLPHGIEERITHDQLEAILAHEMCHIQRRDNLTGAIHMVVEALFWFHPLVWFIRTKLVAERELACDEEVLQAGADPDAYAEGILALCRLCLESPLICVSGITGADLKRRVTHIMTYGSCRDLGRAKKMIIIATVLAAVLLPIMAGALSAQRQPETATTREFDAVSVKPMQQKGPMFAVTWHVDPTMLRVTGEPLATYVEQAYNLKPYQVVSNGLAWIESDRFDIQARTAAPATQAEMTQMLRPVLADRFQLQLHRETRQIPVYFLQVDRHGPKLQAASITQGANLTVHKNDVTATHLALDDFADVLGQFITDRPVINRTGLKIEYQFKLEFASVDDANAGPSIFSALPEQLGLKLEAGKAPVEVLVIDHAERPRPN